MICPGCLIKDMANEKPLYELIQELLSNMENKTPKEMYESRLGKCKECKYLQGGMCGLCGCFVEVRAAGTTHYCPDTPKRW